MAVIIGNPDGTSNAQIGDVVVTGGGVYEKTATGSRLVATLKDFLGKDKTTSYAEVGQAYQSYMSAVSAGAAYGGSASANRATQTAAQRAADTAAAKNSLAAAEDQNGIAVTGISGYDPGNYVASGGSSAASSTGSNIVGYVILFLVGVAVLDRFMNKGAK